jgi:hypothetical protein
MSTEYWSSRGMVITVEGPYGRFCATIEKPFARIGAHGSSEVVLSHKDVPPRSVYLHATDAGVFYVHLTATDADREEDRCGWLAPDQIIEVGPYRLAAQLTDGPAKTEVPPPDFETPDDVVPYPLLLIVRGGRPVAHFPLRRPLTVVGRGRRSTLPLPDVRISSVHCVLYREGYKLWAIDLLSSNGTLLNGLPLEAARVAPGESLVVGDMELVYMRSQEHAMANGGAGVCTTAVLCDEDDCGRREEEELSNVLMDDNLDDLTRHVTCRMIQFERQARWRRRLLTAAVALLVLSLVAGAVVFLSKCHIAGM